MKTIIGAFALAFCASAFAYPGVLEREWVNGQYRYCKYNNGVVVTVNAYDLCPLMIQ